VTGEGSNNLNRWRTVLVAVMGLLAFGVAAAWLMPPLAAGSSGVAQGPPGSGSTIGEDDVATIVFVPDGRVAFGVEVRNATFLPVTIVGLRGVDDDSLQLVGATAVLGDGVVVGLDTAHTRPFEAVSLAPGETTLVGIAGNFPDCANAHTWATGAGIQVDRLWLAVNIAGVLPREVEVPLLREVALVGSETACP
jgi:hypothetical protein